jgi:Trk-type K+ transport system membrane component
VAVNPLVKVRAVANNGWFTDAGKIVMSMLMVMGRPEKFASVILFTPRSCRAD